MRGLARGFGIIAAVWCVAAVTAIAAMKLTGNTRWPSSLGPLASVEKRVRPHATNASAQRLIALSAPIGISFSSTPRSSSRICAGARSY